MRVLLVNHTGTASGAEQALLDIARSLRAEVDVSVLCPAGELADAVAQLSIEWLPLQGTDVSFRLHPVHTTRGLSALAISAAELRRTSRSFDLIHANSARAGLICAAGCLTSGPPFVVQLHDVSPSNPVAAGVNTILKRRSAGLFAVSEYVARSVDPQMRSSRVIFNSIDLDRFRAEPRRREQAGALIDLPYDVPVLGVVGQLTPRKAQDDAIRIHALVRERHPTAQLLIVGSVKFAAAGTAEDNVGYERSLHDLVRELGVEDSVHFLGERQDVPDILQRIDVLLIPSLVEPLARAAMEAMATSVPVVITAEGGWKEVVQDRISGRVLPPRDPRTWAMAVSELLEDPAAAAIMGRRGREAVEPFESSAYAQRLVERYREIVNLEADRKLIGRR